MKKAKRKYTRRVKEPVRVTDLEQVAGELTENTGREPLTEGLVTTQINYGTINLHIYR